MNYSAKKVCVMLLLSIVTLCCVAEESFVEPPALEVFVHEGCPHCAKAKLFLKDFQQEHPRLKIVFHELDYDRDAAEKLDMHFRRADRWPPGVPSFVYSGHLLVGFHSAEKTGPELLTLINQQEPPASLRVTRVETPLFGTLDVETLGLPLFTLAIGLLDGFNPCAMWVLLFLLSLLVHLHDRLRMTLIAGTFVLVSGIVYYAFMAAWLNVFLAVGMSAALRTGLGLLAVVIGLVNIKDFRSSTGFTLSIPTGVKPGLYSRMRSIVNSGSLLWALASAAVLAVLVNIIELLCTAGFPAIYTAILVQQELSPVAHYAYLALYILGYLTDDALMVGTAVLALSSKKLTESAGRWLKLVSGLVMLILGAVMILRPEWLV